mgnify:CR=1 FL=1
MKIGPKISQAGKKFGKVCGKCLVKGVGIGALGLVAWDSNVYGKLRADQYAQSKDAKYMTNSVTNTLFESDPSIVTAKIKEQRLKLTMRENVRHFFNRGIGYIGGFVSQMISNAIPFALGMGTLLTKGKWAKGFAIATGIYGLVVILKDGFGLGHSKDLTNPF